MRTIFQNLISQIIWLCNLRNIVMFLFDLLHKSLVNCIYDYLNTSDQYSLAKTINDKDQLYTIYTDWKSHHQWDLILLNYPDLFDLTYTLPIDDPSYNKIYHACPYLHQLPRSEQIIIAGGFINIGIDSQLNYDDLPTSDIDIFVTSYDAYKQVITYFDTLNAQYKLLFDIVNVFLPNYSRKFQIIHVANQSVVQILLGFHSSHVKCGLYLGMIILTPDCLHAVKNHCVFIDKKQITAKTLYKIIQRNYRPLGLEHLKVKDILDKPTIKRDAEIEKSLQTQNYVTSETCLRLTTPIDFNLYRLKNDLGLTSFINNQKPNEVKHYPLKSVGHATFYKFSLINTYQIDYLRSYESLYINRIPLPSICGRKSMSGNMELSELVIPFDNPTVKWIKKALLDWCVSFLSFPKDLILSAYTDKIKEFDTRAGKYYGIPIREPQVVHDNGLSGQHFEKTPQTYQIYASFSVEVETNHRPGGRRDMFNNLADFYKILVEGRCRLLWNYKL